MAHIAIIHNTLDFQGGADVVCLQTIATLQPAHDITLFTVSETSPAKLASKFNIQIDSESLKLMRPPAGMTIASILSAASEQLGDLLASRSVLIQWYFRQFAEDFDAVVSTANELDTSIPSLQYIHYPQFWHADDGRIELANTLVSSVGAPQRQTLSDHKTTVVANSQWTADVFHDRYGVMPAVVHPPIAQIECPHPWNARQDGIVVIGRLAPDKRQHKAIELIDRLRADGYDLHLHIAGSVSAAYGSYVRALSTAAAKRSYVHVERDISRKRLEQLLCEHKYGLNLKQREHFGMSVAEYVSAGLHTLVHDSGGQRDIVRHREEYLFETIPQAVDQIEMIHDTDIPPELSSDHFGISTFRSQIKSFVDSTLSIG